jgi:hypothetical protein
MIIKAFVQLIGLFGQAFRIPKTSSGVGIHQGITQNYHRKDQKVGVEESGDR